MNMVQKFEAKTWYDIDLLLDWKKQQVSIYVNGEPKKDATANFFINEKRKKKDPKSELTANAISIYGLSPAGTSYFRNIKVCADRCEKSKDDLTYLGGVA